MHPAVEQIRQYLQLIALQFVQHPEQAELRVAESPQGDAVRFRLILEKTDVARIIGRNGMTASAIRSLAKAAGEKHGIKVIAVSYTHLIKIGDTVLHRRDGAGITDTDSITIEAIQNSTVLLMEVAV